MQVLAGFLARILLDADNNDDRQKQHHHDVEFKRRADDVNEVARAIEKLHEKEKTPTGGPPPDDSKGKIDKNKAAGVAPAFDEVTHFLKQIEKHKKNEKQNILEEEEAWRRPT